MKTCLQYKFNTNEQETHISALCTKHERKVKKTSLSTCKTCSEVSEVSWIKRFILGILMAVLKRRILLREGSVFLRNWNIS